MDLFGHTDVAAEKFFIFALCMTMIEVQHTKSSYSLSGAAVLIDSLAITSKSPQIHRLCVFGEIGARSAGTEKSQISREVPL